MSARQVLVIDPPTVLKFKAPFNIAQTVDLKLYNPTGNFVLYKLKTTAPKRYCVRPNSGTAAPRSNITVSISYQLSPGDADNDPSKHKFLVQSIVVPPEMAPESAESLWKETATDGIGATRLRCAFEVEGIDENGSSVALPEPAVNKYSSEASSLNGTPDDDGVADTGTDGGPPAAENVAVDNQHLRARISQLTDDCARLRENELRLRRMATPQKSSPKVDTTTTEVAASSVNVQVLLIVAFVALFVGIVLGKFVL